MSQMVIARPATTNQALPTPNLADIAGLTTTIMTGSGWIRLLLSLWINNTYAGDNLIEFQFLIDGTPVPSTIREEYVANSSRSIITICELYKPGAGQHVFNVQGLSQHPSAIITDLNAAFIVEEPGY